VINFDRLINIYQLAILINYINIYQLAILINYIKLHLGLECSVKDTPLIRNWQSEKYMNMVIGKNKSKVNLLAGINSKKIVRKMKVLKEVNNKIPKEIRTILKSHKSNDKLKLSFD